MKALQKRPNMAYEVQTGLPHPTDVRTAGKRAVTLRGKMRR